MNCLDYLADLWVVIWVLDGMKFCSGLFVLDSGFQRTSKTWTPVDIRVKSKDQAVETQYDDEHKYLKFDSV